MYVDVRESSVVYGTAQIVSGCVREGQWHAAGGYQNSQFDRLKLPSL